MVQKRWILILTSFILLATFLFSCSDFSGNNNSVPNLVFVSTDSTTSSDSLGKNDNTDSNDGSINIKMVGDILLHEKVVESGLKDDGTYEFDSLFSVLKPEIESADIAIANQEVILGGSELGLSGYPAFNGPYEIGDALVKAGFDIIAHATNHALDKSKEGIVNCLNFWNSKHPSTTILGINLSQEQQNTVCIKDEKGIKIAYLNYTYGTNGISTPSDMPFAVNYLDEIKIISDLKYAEENADFTIVIPHWGTEYTHETDSSQAYWTEIFVQNGADLIIGAHPHVIEPIEWYTSGNNKALVYYSLGNYVSCTAESGTGKCDRMLGAIADITIEKDVSGNVSISNYGVIPIVTQIEDGFGGIRVYKLSDYTEELASKSYTSQIDSTFSISYYNSLCTQVFGDLYTK